MHHDMKSDSDLVRFCLNLHHGYDTDVSRGREALQRVSEGVLRPEEEKSAELKQELDRLTEEVRILEDDRPVGFLQRKQRMVQFIRRINVAATTALGRIRLRKSRRKLVAGRVDPNGD